MNNKDFVSEVVNGVKQAFKPALSDNEIADNLYEFDPMLYGDWSLGIGGESDIIKLCGHPVEFAVTYDPDVPEELGISIIGGRTADVDSDRVYELINRLEEQLGEEIVMNDVSEDDLLILEFNIEITESVQISEAIADTVNRLTKHGTEQLTEELFRLCDK